MTVKKTKPGKPGNYTDASTRRRTRTLQIIFALFSIILILSMVLSLVSN